MTRRSGSQSIHSRSGILAAVAIAAGVLAGAAPAAAGAAATATNVRIGDHAAYVRVVISVSGDALAAGEIVASDANPFDGRAVIPIDRARAVSGARSARRAHGLTVRLTNAGSRMVVRLTNARRHFKYLSYAVERRPQRLVIDLWKSAPPSRAAEVRAGRDGCLSLTSISARGKTLSASGRERNLFEHGLIVRLRGADGRVVRTTPRTAAAGRWAAQLRRPSNGRGSGTLEAVALSAKDGALVCIVQARVALKP